MKTPPVEQLRRLFSAGYELTYEEMTTRLERSSKQVSRYLDEIRESGVPVVERRVGNVKRFSVPEAHRTVETSIGFTEEELLSLTVAAQASRSALLGTPFDEPLRRAYAKLLGSAEQVVMSFDPELEQDHWHFDAGAHANVDATVLQGITHAATACETIKVEYYSASEKKKWHRRAIDPYVVAVRGTSWLLVCYCHEEQKIVDLSIPAISSVEATGSYFLRQDDFDPQEHFRDRFSALGDKEVYEIRLSVSPDKAPYFHRKTYHPTQQVETEHEDGSLTVSFEVSGLKEISAFIRSWGPGVLAVDPATLAERLADDARQVASDYASSVVHA